MSERDPFIETEDGRLLLWPWCAVPTCQNRMWLSAHEDGKEVSPYCYPHSNPEKVN